MNENAKVKSQTKTQGQHQELHTENISTTKQKMTMKYTKLNMMMPKETERSEVS